MRQEQFENGMQREAVDYFEGHTRNRNMFNVQMRLVNKFIHAALIYFIIDTLNFIATSFFPFFLHSYRVIGFEA